ncbi:platelet-activating factor acetylhydrolase IB subunit gamma [Ditylenchus destructor]|nr:platelet-activating factor acetylhydrolase IB subunit gamma [Ditylenchus destructor]
MSVSPRESCPKECALWKELHEWFVSQAKSSEADVLFIGGDHISWLPQSRFYADNFEPLHCLCFGSFGDSIFNLLWRIENGEVENFIPKPEEFLSALSKIAEILKEKQPAAEIFFLQLTPIGRMQSQLRDFVSQVNAKMESALNGKASVVYLDPSLIDQNGEVNAHLLYDFAHLSQAGYETVFEPVFAAVSSVFNP